MRRGNDCAEWEAILLGSRYHSCATDYPAPCGLVGLKGRHVLPLEQPSPHADARGVSVSPWSAVLAIFGARRVSIREVRAEAFFLGGRHKGEIREGARKELLAPGLDPERAALLRAVIRTTPPSTVEGARP